jgi:hypothetical protein
MTPQSSAGTPSIWGRTIEITLPEERASRHGHRTVGGLKLADQSLDSLPWLTAYYWGILSSSLRHWFASRVRGQARAAVWRLRSRRPCPVSFTNLESYTARSGDGVSSQLLVLSIIVASANVAFKATSGAYLKALARPDDSIGGS